MKTIGRDRFGLLLRSACIKPRLIKELRFVPEEIHDWQDREFIAVTNRSRSAGVVVYPDAEAVLPFGLKRRSPNALGRIEPIICDICATWRRGTESAVITFERQGSTVSFLCCEDLLCSLHVRDKTKAAKLSRTQLRENITIEGRIERLCGRLDRIVTQILNST